MVFDKKIYLDKKQIEIDYQYLYIIDSLALFSIYKNEKYIDSFFDIAYNKHIIFMQNAVS